MPGVYDSIEHINVKWMIKINYPWKNGYTHSSANFSLLKIFWKNILSEKKKSFDNDVRSKIVETNQSVKKTERNISFWQITLVLFRSQFLFHSSFDSIFLSLSISVCLSLSIYIYTPTTGTVCFK